MSWIDFRSDAVTHTDQQSSKLQQRRTQLRLVAALRGCSGLSVAGELSPLFLSESGRDNVRSRSELDAVLDDPKGAQKAIDNFDEPMENSVTPRKRNRIMLCLLTAAVVFAAAIRVKF